MPGIMVGPDDVCIYMTEACNSNCIMCPMSLDSRRRGDSMTDEWEGLKQIDPTVVRHLTLTGGEPFLQVRQLLDAMRYINACFPERPVLILTNGRALSIPGIFAEFSSLLNPHYTIAIPIHAAEENLHDQISQAPGSFRQTMKGIRNLSSTRANIEIRIVGNRLNLGSLNDTFRMLADLPVRISVINLIAMEMTGCAARNRDQVWVPYDQVIAASEAGIQYAVLHGINVGLYNFPLCSLPERLWPMSKKSITPFKIRYDPLCDRCTEKEACGGMFYSTYELHLVDVKPFSGESV